MTTRREIGWLVAPLLAAHPELRLVNDAIFVVPVRHVIRAVLLDRTHDRDRCRPTLVMGEAFAKQDGFPIVIGRHIPHASGLWRFSDERAPRMLVEAVERFALPELASADTIEGYVREVDRELPGGIQPAKRILHLLALGALERARVLMDHSPQATGFWRKTLGELGVLDEVLRCGDQTPIKARATIAGLLHSWEAYTVDGMGIRDIWEKTPFPIEMDGPTS